MSTTNTQIMEVLTSINARLDTHEAALTKLLSEEPTPTKEAPVPTKTKTTRKAKVESNSPNKGERQTKTYTAKAISDRLANLQRDKKDPLRKNPGGVRGMMSKANCRDLLAGETIELVNSKGGTWVVSVKG